jgi:CheY-like chemotaxis protein
VYGPSLHLKPGNYLKLSVSDTGTGIPEDIMDAVFEPYFTTKNPGEGSGMGLAIVHGIVKSYGGTIHVESKPGEKTVFDIYLPVIPKQPAGTKYMSATLPSGNEHILFVDDEPTIGKMGALVLQQLGYKVTDKKSSVEALELFRSQPNDFDLVITDMTMPNMTGDKLAVEMMRIRPNIPVILCTGYSKKISDKIVQKLGVKAVAYKPLLKKELAEMVRQVLDRSRIS